jgi:TRAP-type C4-dicarboxylate transport system permease small subunit
VKLLRKIDSFIESFASAFLTIAVSGMLLLAILSIVLRWFSITLLWVEPLIRHLVFLSAFMGGVLATGRKTHIGIDILGKYFESKNMMVAHAWVGRIIALVSFLTLLVLIKSGIDFVSVEAKYGKAVFLGIHGKYLVSIIPFGLSLIAYRFFYLLLNSWAKEPAHD